MHHQTVFKTKDYLTKEAKTYSMWKIKCEVLNIQFNYQYPNLQVHFAYFSLDVVHKIKTIIYGKFPAPIIKDP